MKKILPLILLFVPCYSFGSESMPIKIIPRSEWGANEEFTYRESSYWQEIIEKRLSTPSIPLSDAERKKRNDIYTEKIDYINTNFAAQYTVTETITHYETEKLAWKIQKSDYVNAIIVHHTDTEYSSSQKGVQSIYKYHALNRQWGDIGYNYIIGYNGEIYEGRKGGDYSVAAHSKWNNISTVGIAVLGNYQDTEINAPQYQALEQLVQHLSLKYGIDLSKDYYYNYDCSGAACNVFPLETHIHKTLVGHRDTGHTNCPGDALYKQIEQIRLDNIGFTSGFQSVKRGEKSPYLHEKRTLSHHQDIIKKLKSISPEKLEQLIILIDRHLETEKNEENIKKLKIVKILTKQVLKD